MKESTRTLKPLSNQASYLVEGAIYEHYKGNRYKLIAVARHSETLEEMVVYRALYEDYSIWVRPLGMFMENVVVGEKVVPRFKKIV